MEAKDENRMASLETEQEARNPKTILTGGFGGRTGEENLGA